MTVGYFILAVITGVVGLASLYYLGRQSSQGIRESQRQAIQDAVTPVERDRDFYRNRVAELESELRQERRK